MRFGEFLVSRGTITPQQLVRALAKQHQKRPFIPELVVRLGMVSNSDVAFFAEDVVDGEGKFLEWLKRTGRITEMDLENIVCRWRRSAPPLGELLVELGEITDLERIESLNRFSKLHRNGQLESSTP
jgi:two-component system chemotaxis sensor kinase CheA